MGTTCLEDGEGMRWALGQAGIPGDAEVVAGTIDRDQIRSALSADACLELDRQMGGDGFAIVNRDSGWVVTGPRRRSVIYGLKELDRCLREDRPAAGTRRPSFDLRVYKFEFGFPDSPEGWTCTACETWGRGLWFEHADAFWTRLFQEMSRRRFNTLALWTISPFEH